MEQLPHRPARPARAARWRARRDCAGRRARGSRGARAPGVGVAGELGFEGLDRRQRVRHDNAAPPRARARSPRCCCASRCPSFAPSPCRRCAARGPRRSSAAPWPETSAGRRVRPGARPPTGRGSAHRAPPRQVERTRDVGELAQLDVEHRLGGQLDRLARTRTAARPPDAVPRRHVPQPRTSECLSGSRSL